MDILDFSDEYLSSLVGEAQESPRKRQHRNIHTSYADNCQRFMNAICAGSYIAPHRHLLDPRDECLIAIRGLFAAITFDELGGVDRVTIFGTEMYDDVSVGVELAASVWHTIVALEENSVLLEVKAGPFNPGQAKEAAPWAPPENGIEASSYYDRLVKLCLKKYRMKL